MFPLASSNVQVTTVVPCVVIGNVTFVVPVIVPAQLSVAVGAVSVSTIHSAVISESIVMSATGWVVSISVMVWLCVLTLLLSSAAVQILVMTELLPMPATSVSV